MLFWLNFIASIPLAPATSAVAQLSNINDNLVAEKPVTTSPHISQFSTQPTLAQVGGGLVLLLLLSIFAYTRIYVITPTKETFANEKSLK